jgi:hypothetical protein
MVRYLVRQILVERVEWPILYGSSFEDLRRVPTARCRLVEHILASPDLGPVVARHRAGQNELFRLFRYLRASEGVSRTKGMYVPVETLVQPRALDFALSHLMGRGRPRSDAEGQAIAALRAYLLSQEADTTTEGELPSEEVGQAMLLDLDACEEDCRPETTPVVRAGREHVEWEDVRPLAHEAFKVWSTDWQYHWAREAWSILADKGLTSYQGGLERAEVYLRMLALGCLYRDFCDLAADERHYREDWVWVEEVGLSADVFHPLTLGMMIGTDGERLLSEADDLPEDGSYQSIIEPLVDEQRRVVHQALVEGYGSPHVLWAMLQLTLRRDFLDRYSPEPDIDPLNGVLNDVTVDDTASYDWVENGCEVIRSSGGN